MTKLKSSFRDPSGYLYLRDGVLLRHVAASYRPTLDALLDGGFYDDLAAEGAVVPVERLDSVTLRPERIPFISYPYEWCFEQYRAAGLLTLDIAEKAIRHDFVLKDASAYNIQFRGSAPVLIDSLSFEPYEPGTPWIAYGQFCRHFLAPLALMSLVDPRLGGLMRVHMDGLPLDLASKMMPGRTRFQPGFIAHLHLHGRAQNRPADAAKVAPKVSKTAILALIDSLRRLISRLPEPRGATEWGKYYGHTNYAEASEEAKAALVSALIGEVSPSTCWDLGANSGTYSRLAAASGAHTVAWDIDPQAVAQAYRDIASSGETRLLPLMLDLANPSPDLGWAHEERDSLVSRGPVDLVMALALVHHLAIGNNVPLPRIAEFLARLGRHLILEFVPKEDSQVQRMLANRRDVFDDYGVEGFESAFGGFYEILRREPVSGTVRTLYLLRRR